MSTKVKLKSTQSPYFYTKIISTRMSKAKVKLALNKWDPVLRKVVLFKQEKI